MISSRHWIFWVDVPIGIGPVVPNLAAAALAAVPPGRVISRAAA